MPLNSVSIRTAPDGRAEIRQLLPANMSLVGPLPEGWYQSGQHLHATGSVRDLTLAAYAVGVSASWTEDWSWDEEMEPGDRREPITPPSPAFRLRTTNGTVLSQTWLARRIDHRTLEIRARHAAWPANPSSLPTGVECTVDGVPFLRTTGRPDEAAALLFGLVATCHTQLGVGVAWDDDSIASLAGDLGSLPRIVSAPPTWFVGEAVPWPRTAVRAAPLPPAFRLGFEAFREAIRCGFELETQSSAGVTSGNLRETAGLDQVGYDVAVATEVATRLADPTNWVALTNLRRLPADALAEILRLIAGRGDQPPEQIREAITASVRSDAALRQRFEQDATPAGYFRQLGPGLVAGTDGTVAGFEFRTQGPQEYWEVMRHAARLFRPFDRGGAGPHVVDTHCSFHVHVSVPALAMAYDANVQARLMNYILDHLAAVPTTVLRRWADTSWLSRYFPIVLANQKMAFVSYRGNHRTWEFRCFGNLNKLSEAKACVDLAVQAMHHGYSKPGPTALYTNASARIATELRKRDAAALAAPARRA